MTYRSIKTRSDMMAWLGDIQNEPTNADRDIMSISDFMSDDELGRHCVAEQIKVYRHEAIERGEFA